VCKECALGKYTKIDFPSNENMVVGTLNLIHFDVCG
jgi:hypothetical protein